MRGRRRGREPRAGLLPERGAEMAAAPGADGVTERLNADGRGKSGRKGRPSMPEKVLILGTLNYRSGGVNAESDFGPKTIRS